MILKSPSPHSLLDFLGNSVLLIFLDEDTFLASFAVTSGKAHILNLEGKILETVQIGCNLKFYSKEKLFISNNYDKFYTLKKGNVIINEIYKKK